MSKRKRCDMCGRLLPLGNRHGVWCARCLAEHAVCGPCPSCDGAIHLPDDGYGMHITTLEGKRMKESQETA